MLLVFFIMLHGCYYFSSGESFFKIPDDFRDLTFRVTSIDNWHDYASFKKLLQKNQIILFAFHVGRSSWWAFTLMIKQGPSPFSLRFAWYGRAL